MILLYTQFLVENRPTDKEYLIYDTYNKVVDASPNVAEKILEKQVARDFGITTQELRMAYAKVVFYNSK
jgi:hypothetical protein